MNSSQTLRPQSDRGDFRSNTLPKNYPSLPRDGKVVNRDLLDADISPRYFSQTMNFDQNGRVGNYRQRPDAEDMLEEGSIVSLDDEIGHRNGKEVYGVGSESHLVCGAQSLSEDNRNQSALQNRDGQDYIT